MKTRLMGLLASTAIVAAGAVSAAQHTMLTDEEMAALEGECRDLAQALEAGELDGFDEERIATALKSNAIEECKVIFVEAEAETSAVATERVAISEDALIEGLARVRVPAPEVDVDVPAPSVSVTTSNPQVSIREGESTIEIEQAQPVISVEIPEIIIRVEIPAPKLYVRRSDPSVEVSSADPQVEVQQGDPVVSVTQGEPEIAVDLSLGDDTTETATSDAETTADGGEGATGGEVRIARAEASVELLRSDEGPQVEFQASEPSVTFEGQDPKIDVMVSNEPQVQITQMGDVEVIFETDEERETRQAAAQSTEASEETEMTAEAEAETEMETEAEAETAAATETTEETAMPETEDRMAESDTPQADLPEMVMIGDLKSMDVSTANGESLGSPEAFIRRDGTLMMIVSEGGFLGLGDTDVGIPLSEVTFTPEGLVLREMTEEQLEQAGDMEWTAEEEVADDMELRVRN